MVYSKRFDKGLDEKMQDVKKKISKPARGVVTAGAAEMSVGTAGLVSSSLQQAFIGLGLGANLTAGGGTPTPTKGAVEVRLKFLEEKVLSLKFGTKSVAIIGQEFPLKTPVAAWLKINCPNDKDYLFCVDAHRF